MDGVRKGGAAVDPIGSNDIFINIYISHDTELFQSKPSRPKVGLLWGQHGSWATLSSGSVEIAYSFGRGGERRGGGGEGEISTGCYPGFMILQQSGSRTGNLTVIYLHD